MVLTFLLFGFFLFSLKGVLYIPDRLYIWRNIVDVEVQEVDIMIWGFLAAGCGPVGCIRFLCVVGGEEELHDVVSSSNHCNGVVVL